MADIIAVTAAAIFVGIAVALAALVYLWTVRVQEDLRKAEREVDLARFTLLRHQLDQVSFMLNAITSRVSKEE